jgi:hypothetical protein
MDPTILPPPDEKTKEPPDPLDDPLIGAVLVGQALREAAAVMGPDYPAHYTKRPPPKPDPAWIEAEAKRLRGLASEQLDEWRDTIERLNAPRTGYVGYFKSDEGAIRAGAVETFRSTALIDEHELGVNWLSQHQLWHVAAHRDEAGRSQAQDIEDFLDCLHEDWKRAHARAGQPPLQRDVPGHLLTYGLLAARVRLNPDALDGDATARPIAATLVDPTTVYPVWEGERGLKRVFRVYRATVGELIGDWDEDGDVERRFRSGRRDNGEPNGKNGERYRDDDLVEVIEYDDRKWSYLAADGIVLRPPTAHEYGRVPWVITVGALTDTASSDLGGFDRLTNGQWVEIGRDASGKQRPRYLAHVSNAKARHDQTEAFLGRLVTSFKQAMNKPKALQQGLLSRETGEVPQIGADEGTTYPIRDDETIIPIDTAPPAQVVNPLIQALSTDRATGSAPLAAHGQNPSANTSGQALDTLGEMGMALFTPHVLTIEQFYGEVADLSLYLWGGYGYMTGGKDAKGRYGVDRTTPRADKPDYFEIDYQAVQQFKGRIRCALKHTKQSATPMLAQAVAVMRREKVMSRLDAIEFIGLFRDPQAVAAAVDLEELEALPEWMRARLLVMAAQKAEKTGDPLDKLAAMFVAQEIGKQNQPPPPPAGPPGAPPPLGGPAPGPAPGVMGLNNAALGAPPGINGAPVGRPPGLAGPPAPNGF